MVLTFQRQTCNNIGLCETVCVATTSDCMQNVLDPGIALQVFVLFRAVFPYVIDHVHDLTLIMIASHRYT